MHFEGDRTLDTQKFIPLGLDHGYCRVFNIKTTHIVMSRSLAIEQWTNFSETIKVWSNSGQARLARWVTSDATTVCVFASNRFVLASRPLFDQIIKVAMWQIIILCFSMLLKQQTVFHWFYHHWVSELLLAEKSLKTFAVYANNMLWHITNVHYVGNPQTVNNTCRILW